MSEPPTWSEAYAARREAQRRFGDIFALPIVRRASAVVLAQLRPGSRLLEVGAGERRLKARAEAAHAGVRYESMDVDRRQPHDYYRLEDARGPYDCIAALEVVEHLGLDELRTLLRQLAELLGPCGRLVLSTPNTFYPPAYLRDVTHRTPLCYDELASLVARAGLHVERIHRAYHDPLPLTLLRRYVFGWLFRLIGIDFARQIVLVAIKR